MAGGSLALWGAGALLLLVVALWSYRLGRRAGRQQEAAAAYLARGNGYFLYGQDQREG